MGPGEVCLLQIAPIEYHPIQLGLPQVGLSQVGITEIQPLFLTVQVQPGAPADDREDGLDVGPGG